MTIKLSIDDLPPMEHISELEAWKNMKNKGKKYWKPKCLHNSSVGINLTKMFDWRKLERRSVELRDKADTFSKEFWHALTRIYEDCNPTKAKKIWIHDESYENDIVYVYHGASRFSSASMSFRTTNDLIKESMPNPDSRAIFIKGEHARALMRLHHRSNDLVKRSNVYVRAFRSAIDARLRPFINDKLEENCYTSAVLVIRNDDREYAARVVANEGIIVWHDRTTTNVYECT